MKEDNINTINLANEQNTIIEKKKRGRPKKQQTGTIQAQQETNIKTTVKTGDDVLPAKRKRGRPKGTKNKTIRKDHDINNAEKGKNRKAIQFSLAFSSLPSVNVNDISQVKQRVSDLFDICIRFDIKPSVAALAMAFHVDRATIFNWLNHKTGTIKDKECFDTIKAAYNQINLLYETYLNDGSIIPVSAFFLMKNNLGYKDVTDHVITASNNENVSVDSIAERAGMLTE